MSKTAHLPMPRTSPKPEEFDYDPRDVVEQLKEYYELYSDSDGSPLSIVGFPDSFLTAIDKIRSRAIIGKTKASISATIACCLEHAIDILNQHSVVETFKHLKSRFDLSVNVDGEAEEVVASFFRNYRHAISVPGGERRKNTNIPTPIKTRLSGLAEDLGVEISTLSVICIMTTMCSQSCVNQQQRKLYASIVEGFMRRIELRVRGTEALMEALL